jgi:hypothetical protein
MPFVKKNMNGRVAFQKYAVSLHKMTIINVCFHILSIFVISPFSLFISKQRSSRKILSRLSFDIQINHSV